MKSVVEARAWFGVCLTVMCAACACASAGECDKARELYERGSKSLSLEERVQDFRTAVQLCPSYAEAHCNLADSFEKLAYTKKDDIEEFNELMDKAVEAYQEAIKSKKDLFPAYLGLGDCYRLLGLYEKSQDAYQRALKLRPGHPTVVSGLDKIRAIKAQETEGFQKAEDIVKHFARSSQGNEAGGLMGVRGYSVLKDRLRFNNILFDEWSAELKRGEAIEQLTELGKALSSPTVSRSKFVVEGHTDDRGPADRNMQLSKDRAEAVKRYLVENFSMDPKQISTQGFGPSRPRFPNDGSQNRLKNRRVEVLFTDKGLAR